MTTEILFHLEKFNLALWIESPNELLQFNGMRARFKISWLRINLETVKLAFLVQYDKTTTYNGKIPRYCGSPGTLTIERIHISCSTYYTYFTICSELRIIRKMILLNAEIIVHSCSRNFWLQNMHWFLHTRSISRISEKCDEKRDGQWRIKLRKGPKLKE